MLHRRAEPRYQHASNQSYITLDRANPTNAIPARTVPATSRGRSPKSISQQTDRQLAYTHHQQIDTQHPTGLGQTQIEGNGPQRNEHVQHVRVTIVHQMASTGGGEDSSRKTVVGGRLTHVIRFTWPSPASYLTMTP